jgi:hypothetical protein
VKVIFSFDYELFFGPVSGSPEKCILEPVDALAQVAKEFHIPLCIFVDAGYLDAIGRFMKNSLALQKQSSLIRRNLDALVADKHEVLLHIHPHWEDTIWTDNSWHFDLSRYCLGHFDPSIVLDIVERYSNHLRGYAPNGRLVAYRAGGWAVQPFPVIGNALAAAGIFIDSSVYPGGRDATGLTDFDFTSAPSKAMWRFEQDPSIEDPMGRFLEIPSSSMSVPPSYYWKLALHRLLTNSESRSFGDGLVRSTPSRKNRQDKLIKLLTSTQYCVTLDGMKASLATAEYRKRKKQGAELLVLLSHPKAMTPRSIDYMRSLVREMVMNGDEIVGFKHFDLVN